MQLLRVLPMGFIPNKDVPGPQCRNRQHTKTREGKRPAEANQHRLQTPADNDRHKGENGQQVPIANLKEQQRNQADSKRRKIQKITFNGPAMANLLTFAAMPALHLGALGTFGTVIAPK